MISVIPSENIILKILEIRTALFRKFGLVSARALPVMIPVGFSDAEIKKDVFGDIALQSFTCTQSSVSTSEGNIFLPVAAPSLFKEIEKLIQESGDHPLFRTYSGIYLCSTENRSDHTGIISYTDSLINQKIIWRKSSLRMIRIESKSRNWWESLEWSTMWERKLR